LRFFAKNNPIIISSGTRTKIDKKFILVVN
jgi:hypothetical protein